MFAGLLRIPLKIIGKMLPDRAGQALARLLARGAKKTIIDAATDTFLGALLSGMDLFFLLSRSFRANIRDYNGRILFVTAEGGVAAAVIFERNDMRVAHQGTDAWDARVQFKNSAALLRFLFSKDRDILDALLKNEVEVDGNLNHVYRFGFLARDLMRRLRIFRGCAKGAT